MASWQQPDCTEARVVATHPAARGTSHSAWEPSFPSCSPCVEQGVLRPCTACAALFTSFPTLTPIPNGRRYHRHSSDANLDLQRDEATRLRSRCESRRTDSNPEPRGSQTRLRHARRPPRLPLRPEETNSSLAAHSIMMTSHVPRGQSQGRTCFCK